VYLFPGENALKQVIGPARPAYAAFEEMLIPDVECWFPGDLPLDLVHEVLTVRVTDRRPKKGPAETSRRVLRIGAGQGTPAGIAADGKITAVPVKGIIGGGKPSFEAGTPVALFDANIAHAGLDTAFEYDVTADGNRFLIDTGPRGGPATQLTAVANWEARLRK